MQSSTLQLRRIIRSLISAVIVLLMMLFPAGRPVFAICAPAPTSGNNNITCDGADDTIDALAGNDQVNGGAGNDSITGGAGNDTLTGGAGNDTLIGGAGTDSFAFDTDSALGTDTLTEASGGGTDTLNFTGSSNAVTVNLATVGNQTVNSNLTINLTAAEVENVTGGTGNDVLTGNSLNNTINGGNGNNTMTGAGGNDTLTGGTGTDVFVFNTDNALGRDVVNGGTGTDSLDFSGSSAAVTVNLATTTADQAVNGNLILRLSANLENITGGLGDDTLTGSTAANTLLGGNGNDTLNGGTGNDTLNGGAGNDRVVQTVNANQTLTNTLATGTGNDTLVSIEDAILTGGTGNNTFTVTGWTGTAIINGAGGTDTIVSSNDADFLLTNALLTRSTGGAFTLTSVERATLTGGAGNNVLDASAFTSGIVTLSGGNGNDSLFGGSQNDSLTGGDGNDTMTGAGGNDSLTGGNGNDIFLFDTDSPLGRDVVNGGAGTDTLNLSDSSTAVTVNLATTTADQTVNGNLILRLSANLENITGGTGDDTLTGSTAANILFGDDGNDTLNGGAGNDTLNGGAGNDRVVQTVNANQTLTNTLVTGTGNDTLVSIEQATLTGGTGNNTFTVSGWTGAAIINGAGGTDTIVSSNDADFLLTNALLTRSTAGVFTLTSVERATLTGGAGNNVLDASTFTLGIVTLSGGNGNDTLLGGSQNDSLTGGDGNDTLGGSDGNDSLTAGNGDDSLSGGNGTDTLTGGNGNDTLNGGSGNDTLAGSAGSDTYVFAGSVLGTDTVNEAANADSDTLDFSAFTPGGTPGVTINLASTATQTVNTGDLSLRLQTNTSVENVIGSADADTVTGNTRNNIFTGGGGNDTLIGATGNDTYKFDTDSALGTDTITEASGGGTMDALDFTGSSNAVTVDLGNTLSQTVNANLNLILTAAQIENVTGGSGDDALTGNSLNNVLNSGDGSDTLNGGDGNDTLNGDNGNDALDGGNGNDALYGGAGNDTLTTGLGVDTLDGGADDDLLIITGTHSAGDVVDGGTGSNIFRFNSGTTGLLQLISNGTDTLDFSLFGTAVTIDLSNSSQQNAGSGLLLTLTGLFEIVYGSIFDDVITGNAADNTLAGGDGNDTLDGNLGDDLLNGNAGNDTLTGNDGIDTLNGGDDSDNLNGGTGNDLLNGDAGDDTLSGGEDDDTLNGDDGNDLLNGENGNDTINGGAGNDTLSTESGIDAIDGGADNDLINITGTHSAGDTVDGGLGANIFVFQPGTSGQLELTSSGMDTLDFDLFGTPVTIDLSNSGQQDSGGGLVLTLSDLFDIVVGSIFDDAITGNSADNTISGGDGADTLEGGDGADTLNGDAGDDLLDGGVGIDSLDGGVDTDTVQNYSAADTHTNIENGFPAPDSETRKSQPQAGLSSFIPVTGGNLTVLSCEANPAILRTQDNGLVFFYDLCGYSVLLNDTISTDMLAALPIDQTYVTGMSLTLMNGNQVVNEVPEGAGATLRVSDPSDLGKTMTAFFWDATAHNGEGAWVEIPLNVNNGYATLTVKISGTYALTVK